jgi:hypothetical protein
MHASVEEHSKDMRRGGDMRHLADIREVKVAMHRPYYISKHASSPKEVKIWGGGAFVVPPTKDKQEKRRGKTSAVKRGA